MDERAHTADAEEVRPGEYRHSHPHEHDADAGKWAERHPDDDLAFDATNSHPHNHWPDDDRPLHHVIDPVRPADADGDDGDAAP